MAEGNFYRGGIDLSPKPFEVKMDPASGLVQPTRGIAVFSRPDYLERFGGSQATGRIEFTCDTVLCGLRHAGNPNRSTQAGKWHQTARFTKSADNWARLPSQLCVDLSGFSGKL